MLATFAVALVPWTARNLGALDALRPFGTQSGYTLASQWNSEAAQNNSFRAVTRNPPQMPEFADLFRRPGMSEVDVEAQLRKRALRFAGNRPDHVLAAVWLNTQRMLEAGPGHTFVSDVAHREMGIPGGWRGSLRCPSTPPRSPRSSAVCCSSVAVNGGRSGSGSSPSSYSPASLR